MDRRTILGNISVAFSAQGVSMVASLFMSLLVPKVLGITNYGYWQLFVFYVSYSGFFHFGLNDGVYLLNGGISRSRIDKKIINSQFRFEVVFQLLIGLIIALVTVAVAPQAERAFIFTAFSIYTVIYNLSGYLGYVFQAMNETRLFSLSTILDRTIFIIPMLVLVYYGIDDFRPYIGAYLISRTCSLVYCCYHARDILRAGTAGLAESVKLSIHSIKVGCSLMLANICDSLILGATRFFIDAAWGIETFGSVSLSLSMVNLFIVFVSQAAMVLFPALRQGTEREQRTFYVTARDAMEMFFPAVYLLYFPMCFVLELWLPQYASSLQFFAMLLPICVFNTKMNICCTTFFKVLRMERHLLLVNIITLTTSVAIAALSIWVLGSIEAALLGTVGCIVGRSLWCEHYLDGLMKAEGGFASIFEVILTIAFVVFTLTLDAAIAIPAYAILYCAYLYIFRNTASSLVRRIRNK